MEELEKTARELILAITEKTLKSLKDKGLLKEPSKLQMLCSSPEMTSLIKKLSAPKYDPNRLFREGDKAKVVKNKGRIGTMKIPVGTLVTVTKDEHECEWVFIKNEESGETDTIDPAYLELVTPAEDLKPYYIEESTGEITLLNKHDPIFHKSWRYAAVSAGIIAFTAAEAERDRLNAEHRKETK